MRQPIHATTARGTQLDGVLFHEREADAVLIIITGIHGNFYSNPFYYLIGDTLAADGFDFVYAQTNDAFPTIQTFNVKTGEQEMIGSWNESFDHADEDIAAYLDWAEGQGYRHIYLGGHSLGANKVIHYLSTHPDDHRIERFLLMSPANVSYMLSGVSQQERHEVETMVRRGRGQEVLPFMLMGWVQCTADTAYQWLFTTTLNNAHTSEDGDFSQAARVNHVGAMLIGTYDNFTNGDPEAYLRLLNSRMPRADENEMIFISHTGHTYQQKEHELVEVILRLIRKWTKQ